MEFFIPKYNFLTNYIMISFTQPGGLGVIRQGMDSNVVCVIHPSVHLSFHQSIHPFSVNHHLFLIRITRAAVQVTQDTLYIHSHTPSLGGLESTVNQMHMFLECGRNQEYLEKAYTGTWTMCRYIHKGL